MNQTQRKERTPYERKLFWRKARMYLMWGLTFIVCLVVSSISFHHSFFEAIDPQIKSAYIQIAKLLPTLEESEASLLETYKLLAQSREDAKNMGITLSSDTIANSRTADEIVEGSYALSRVTNMTVGHNGGVAVARKDTGEIVAHPSKSEIGKALMVSRLSSRDLIDIEGGAFATSVVNYKGIPNLDLNSFANEKEARNIKLRRLILFSGDDKARLTSALGTMFYGSIVPCGPYYIVCGIDMGEYLLYMARAVFISVLACVILWLFVHYIALMLDRHEVNGKDLRKQLTAYSLVLTVAIFCISWYIQVLNSVTNDLNAMQSYADSGVTRLKNFQDTQRQVNNWFDEQYLTQCRIARDYVKSKGVDNITRRDLANLSERLAIKHIYVYDPQGKVIVTNSPYDHLQLSDDPDDPSHAFLLLLQGADHVVQQPMFDGLSGRRLQHIGVSLRNENDLADGFVQISVDPALRDYMTQPLGVDSVLTDMTVGLPGHAIALDKKDLTISATTGFGYIGESIEDFGYNADKLKANRNGFLQHSGKTYYAGFGESDDYYLVPIAERTSNTTAITISLRIALVVMAGLALVLLMALYHYQESVVDAAPPVEEAPEEPEPVKHSLSQSAIRLSGISSIIRVQQKQGFEKRWQKHTAKFEQTPGSRVKTIAYRLLLIFCALSMLPVIYGTLSENARFNGLSYVLTGNWEKGPNIFAVTSCLFLLFALFVFVSLTNRVLYNIARVSDLRMETICLLLRSSLKYVCVIAFIYYGLSQFGIPTQALLASAGIITLAVSMGAKDMVNDIIAGFFILVEGNFKVGDNITVGSWSGTVQEIGLRTTRITRGLDTKIFNNSSIKDIINSDEVTRMTLKLPVGLNASLARLEEILKAELPDMLADVPGVISGPQYGGVNEIADGCMQLSISFEAVTGKHSAANRELTRRLKLMLERHDIEIPVNPVYVYQPNNAPRKPV